MDTKSPRRGRGTRPLFDEVAKTVERGLREQALPGIASCGDTYAAVGIDMATQDSHWGLSVITMGDDMKCGTVRLILPYQAKVEGFDRRRKLEPARHILFELLLKLSANNFITAVAVDVPFGWPEYHWTFLQTWSALMACKPESTSPLVLDKFKYRLCDRTLMACLGNHNNIFAVGADKISSSAFEWASIRCSDDWKTNWQVDLGLSDDRKASKGDVVFFETYPSAFVRLNYPEWTGYKTGNDLSKGYKVSLKPLKSKKPHNTILVDFSSEELSFHIYDDNGVVVRDIEEKELVAKEPQVNALKDQRKHLLGLSGHNKKEKERITKRIKEEVKRILDFDKAAYMKECRVKLMKRLMEKNRLSHDRTEDSENEACSTSASDAFDGFLSAVTALDYLKWRQKELPDRQMSSPSVLLGHEPINEQRKQIEKEGWILVRLSGGQDQEEPHRSESPGADLPSNTAFGDGPSERLAESLV